jgi:hypothetical protein
MLPEKFVTGLFTTGKPGSSLEKSRTHLFDHFSTHFLQKSIKYPDVRRFFVLIQLK